MKEVTFNAKITIDMTSTEIKSFQTDFLNLVFRFQDMINKSVEEVFDDENRTISVEILPVYKVEE